MNISIGLFVGPIVLLGIVAVVASLATGMPDLLPPRDASAVPMGVGSRPATLPGLAMPYRLSPFGGM